jgi:hypothetical protein
MNKQIIVTVVRSKGKSGYTLRHNQSPGFKGIVGLEWGWYKTKEAAMDRANELMKAWNS